MTWQGECPLLHESRARAWAWGGLGWARVGSGRQAWGPIASLELLKPPALESGFPREAGNPVHGVLPRITDSVPVRQGPSPFWLSHLHLSGRGGADRQW